VISVSSRRAFRRLRPTSWPPEKLRQAKKSKVVMFMLTRPRGMTIRDVVMLPTNFDL
jgi:hypothetical protein